MQPKNYREYFINIRGLRVKIAGMAHPFEYADASTVSSASLTNPMKLNRNLEYLTSRGISTIISLDDPEDKLYHSRIAAIESITKELSFNYSLIKFVNFGEASLKQFNDFCALAVKYSTSSHHNGIAVHCAAGMGRTGTMIASLKLRELLEGLYEKSPEDFANPNVDLSATSISASGTVASIAQRFLGGPIPCTSLVYQSIEFTRSQKVFPTTGNNGHASVENAGQINSLNNLHAYLHMQYHRKYLANKDITSKHDDTTVEKTIATL